MIRSRFSEKRIVAVLEQDEAGVTITELRRPRGIGEATFRRWRATYGDLR